MARGLNKVLLIGHLGKDPELRYTPNGTAVCNFSLATTESYKADDGNWVDKTEWHNIVAWRKLAETCSNYLKKGSKIYAEGKITTESYEKDGGDKRYITKVVLNSMIMLDSKGSSGGGQSSSDSGSTESSPVTEDKEDDLPF